MEERAGGDRGLQPTTGAHPQPCARAPAVTAAAVWTREPVRPAQFGQILPTGPLVGEPRPKLLVSPRIVTPTDRSQIASHDRPPYCTQADMQMLIRYAEGACSQGMTRAVERNPRGSSRLTTAAGWLSAVTVIGIATSRRTADWLVAGGC